MTDKISYLRERKYLKIKDREWNPEKYGYWGQLLGDDVCKKLETYSEQYPCYLADDDYIVCGNEKESQCDTDKLWDGLYQRCCCPASGSVALDIVDKATFGPFYRPFLILALDSLQKRLEDCLGVAEEWISDTVRNDFAVGCVNRLQGICARTLIVQMHKCKNKGMLKGGTSREEYEYFCAEIAGTWEFMEDIFSNFPVLFRMMAETLEFMVDFYGDVLGSYREEYPSIQRNLSLKKGEKKISRIQGDFADTHNHGRQVLKIELEQRTQIIYKPHAMDNEDVYESLYDWICGSLGTDSFHYGFLSCGDHSWCDVIESESCTSREQLERYYERFGIHLFLTYLLGTKDLHFENLIAVGEYPVLIDLEALVNIYYGDGNRTIKEEVLNRLSRSVLYSGLLPYYHWNKAGKGVDNSALCGKKGQKYPFQIPVIVNDKTSDMHVEYRQPVSSSRSNLALLNGEFQNPCHYMKNILAGFSDAYRAVLTRKEEFEQQLCRIRGTTSRFLMADTQRYAMALAGSCHPDLLMDGADREIFLNVMWMGRGDEDRNIVDEEVRHLLQGDIPLFYYKTDEKALYSDGKIVEKQYFEKTAYECIVEKLSLLSEQDLYKQSAYIRLSLKMQDDEGKPYLNWIHDKPRLCLHRAEEGMYEKAESLLKKIMEYAVWSQDHREVCWHTVRFDTMGNVTWELTPMNMYLYDGLAGMMLLMGAWNRVNKGWKEIFPCRELNMETARAEETLKKMLFDYTDRGLSDIKSLNSGKTGAFEGESSIIYSYLLMYRMTEKEEYLQYARKHALIVEQLLDSDECYDMLSGNAGAAQILLLLYRITGEKQYISQAEWGIRVLRKAAVPREHGIGWITDPETPPMSGMAHGNAGILMPVMALWSLTGDQKYEELAEEIWKYEHSLYNSRTANWDDVRMEDNTHDAIGAVSWCHGAPGILISRIYCWGQTENETWRNRFQREIRIGYDKLKKHWKRDSWCLCHGNCGNLWMLETAEKFLHDTGELTDRAAGMAEELRNSCFSEKINYLPQEMLNPGLFNGYGGILYFLLKSMGGELPELFLFSDR